MYYLLLITLIRFLDQWTLEAWRINVTRRLEAMLMMLGAFVNIKPREYN
jgi:hypothetical protein